MGIILYEDNPFRVTGLNGSRAQKAPARGHLSPVEGKDRFGWQGLPGEPRVDVHAACAAAEG
ncbi:MAG TPA: hypothetical protein DEA73_09495 [Peptococcaceae bacterium]|nr:hypothetical protein [Peptococcaceae bacterium]